jgi:hypothetical protein
MKKENGYSIFFILNSPYFTFGKILIKSLYKNCNEENISKIYILDTGLTSEQREYVKSFQKVELLDSGINTDFSRGSWSEDWHINIALKLKILKSIVEQVDEPVLMIDGDCMVTKDLQELLDFGGDIQLCYRGDTDPETPYLGSYVGIINNKKCISFIDDCINDMEISANRYLDGKLWPKESKSISKIAMSYKGSKKLDIKDFKLSEVSEFSPINIHKCHIVHFKGSALSETEEELIKTRIYDRGFGHHVSEYLDD